MRQVVKEPAPAPVLKIGALVSPDVKVEIVQWATAEDRSERAQVAALLRRLVTLRKTQPHELQRLGLMEALAN